MKSILLTMILAFGITTALLAEEAPKVATYAEPILITAAGQAADILIMRGLCVRSGLDIMVSNQATADSLGDAKTLILVAGGSSKGLGAAKVDISSEQARINAIVKSAKEKGITILTFHIGGEARRGALSDPFNSIAANGADYIIVAADGDNDGFFKKIATDKKIQYKHIERTIDAVPLLKEKFGKE